MRYLLVILVVLLCSGCSVAEKIAPDEIAPVIKLKYERVHISDQEDIDTNQYVESVTDDKDGDLLESLITNIDTSNPREYVVSYFVEDEAGNTCEEKLYVNRVEMFDDEIYNPNSIDPLTVENPEDITVLVNKTHQIPEGWEPDDLVKVCDSEQYLRKEAAEAYEKLYNEAVSRNIAVFSISGYRTNDTQTRYWTNMCNVYGIEYASAYSAYPGRSEHQLGLAIDVSFKTTGDRLSAIVADSEIGKFMATEGHNYGFIIRYPEDKVAITNYGYEPWHLRYVGVDLATELYESGLTLEEYYKEI